MKRFFITPTGAILAPSDYRTARLARECRKIRVTLPPPIPEPWMIKEIRK